MRGEVAFFERKLGRGVGPAIVAFCDLVRDGVGLELVKAKKVPSHADCRSLLPREGQKSAFAR
jgi:hypothetical protein